MKKKKKNCIEFKANGIVNVYDNNGKKPKLKKKKYKDGLEVQTNIDGLKRTGKNTFEFKYEI